MRRSRKRSGTSMVEILIAVAFLAVCAASILDSVLTANGQASYATRRALVVAAIQNDIESVRGDAANGVLAARSTSVDRTPAGFPSPVKFDVTVAGRADSLHLFDVTVRATWTDEAQQGSRAESVTIKTIVRQR